MEAILTYLKKHTTGESLIQKAPEKGLKYIIVIPAYLETRLEESLVSLFNAEPPLSPVEIIVVINFPDDASEEDILFSRKAFESVTVWALQHSTAKKRFHIVQAGFIPRKKAGVGYARKTGLDEAVRRLLQAGQQDGILISFDADTKCDAGYLKAIEDHFHQNPKVDGCSVYFEHPLEGNDYPMPVYTAITQYELHMRYYLQAVKYSGFPNAFYTVGSAFAVRSSAYCRQGGMNIRQAGEDFYFLQKFFDLGNFSDLLTTRVCPSPRPSLRVPFGTGKAIDQLLNSGEGLKSYNPEIFELLKELFSATNLLYRQLSDSGKVELSVFKPCMKEFLQECDFQPEIQSIFLNSGSEAAFLKRFYRYFNMFRILKFARHARKTYPDLDVSECAFSIMQKTGMKVTTGLTEKEMLLLLRQKDLGIIGSQ